MRALAAAVGLAALVSAAPAHATGLSDYDATLDVKPKSIFDLSGYLRLRGAALHNLDLDRGPTPSGELLYPVPLSPAGDEDGARQTVGMADMRLRADLAAYWPDGGVAVKARIDALDNVALGSGEDGLGLTDDDPAIRIRRAYAEVLTPLGLVAAGRMGNHWGLGMLANGGDCDTCDAGDSADRLAFITPIAGHLWAAAFDFQSGGPFLPTRAGNRVIDVAPSAQAFTLTFAAMRMHSDAALARRRAAGRWTFEYGALASHRWQADDIPSTYIPTAQPVPVDQGQLMARGLYATAADLWLRLTSDVVRVEVEAAYLHAELEQASLIPGALFRDPVFSNQIGVAWQSSFGPLGGFQAGLDGGFASGDSAPGFGAFPQPGATAAQPGDLDGPQASPPFDDSVDNFRFHPDYRVDRILFREILGTITDAIYIRPHFEVPIVKTRRGTLRAGVAGIVSIAAHAQSTPGGEQPLGVEIDPTIAYDTPSGFRVALEQATLVPLAGLDNPVLGLDAQPAQLWRIRMMFGF